MPENKDVGKHVTGRNNGQTLDTSILLLPMLQVEMFGQPYQRV